MSRKLSSFSFGIPAMSLALAAQSLWAQSNTTGDLTGAVTDASGAAIVGATVTLENPGTGSKQTSSTGSTGEFRFSFVQPSRYTVTVEQSGFQTAKKSADVGVGQATTVNFQLGIQAANQAVEVSESAATVQTENGDITTTFTSQQIANLPIAGNDLTGIIQTSPGVVMNTQGGYGNFASFGISASSNLFTLNGQNDNDPYLNLNNSGATNLLLGANEIAEASIVSNGYSGQYGQLAGAQVNYITKSGSNQFHGNAVYYWNGRTMNANNFFNNASDTPRPFDNANQWAASGGGPIIKNKLFFFANYEGLRVVLPTSTNVLIPSQQFQAATLANLASTGQTQAIPFYQNMFNIYNSSPGASNATPVAGGGCNGFTGLPSGVPCASQFRSTLGNFTHEYDFAVRGDWNISEKDRFYARIQRDVGVQATYTDPLNPIFNALSPQPEEQAQLDETHIFGPTATNEFKASGLYYAAQFRPGDLNATLSTFPTTVIFAGGEFTGIGGIDYVWPQGRNVTQYQFVDDFSKIIGNHVIKSGFNFHRNDITDLTFGVLTSGIVEEFDLADFYSGGGGGGGNLLEQSFPTANEQPMALYDFGWYIQDDWKIGKNLKINIGLRLDHNAIPNCQTDCFARLNSPFTELNHDENIPYNQAITDGLHFAYNKTDAVIWQPRLGFAWSPHGNDKWVVRGGGGIFGDAFQASVVDSFATNPPQSNTFLSFFAPITPGVSGGLFDQTSQANQSFRQAFASGGTLGSIEATNPLFSPPTINASDDKLRQPRYYEWNIEVQRQLPWNSVLSVNYVGNRGVYIPIQNNGLNAYCDPTTCPNGFAGLPSTAPDPRFTVANQFQSMGITRYNGLVASLSKHASHGWSFQLNYTYSHALDDVSNGGLNSFDLGTAGSLLFPQDPYNVKAYNYGNADYDVRHYFSANYVWDDVVRHMYHGGPKALFGGWTIAGTIFARSGMPFTVVDTATTSALSSDNYGGTIFATPITSGYKTCSSSAAKGTACLSTSDFADTPDAAPSGFGDQTRNQYRGPDYFNTDLNVTKKTMIGEHVSLNIGFQFYNLFNHPNFDKPVNDIANPLFGTITSTLNTPTSILGSFLGGDASPRIIQLKAEIRF